MSIKVLLLNVGRVIGAKGGAEKVFCDMANALSERGMDVHAVCCEDKKGLPGYQLSEAVCFVNAGNRTFPWGLSDSLIRFRALLTTNRKMRRSVRARLLCRRQALQLSEVLSAIDPDVIVAFQPESAYVCRDLLHLSTPLITVFHNSADHFLGAPEFEVFQSAVLRSNALVVLMPEYKVQVEKALPGLRVEYIPNAIPFSEQASQLDHPLLITVGRADAQKRHLLLLEAFDLIKDRYPQWNLDIWGETHARYGELVLKDVQRRGLQGRVRHRGLTENVNEKLLGASIFAFPSAYEGFSLALGEAMSAGLPTVGCVDCPSVNTLIRSGENGLLTEPTAEAFAEGLVSLMEDAAYRRKLGAQAREDMRRFGPDAVWRTWQTLLDEVAR